MVQIVVDALVAKQITDATGPILFIDPEGKALGSLERPIFTPEEVERGLKRLEEPGEWISSEQVMEHLRKLGAKPCGTR